MAITRLKRRVKLRKIKMEERKKRNKALRFKPNLKNLVEDKAEVKENKSF